METSKQIIKLKNRTYMFDIWRSRDVEVVNNKWIPKRWIRLLYNSGDLQENYIGLSLTYCNSEYYWIPEFVGLHQDLYAMYAKCYLQNQDSLIFYLSGYREFNYFALDKLIEAKQHIDKFLKQVQTLAAFI